MQFTNCAPLQFTFLLQASKELPKQHLPFGNTRSRFRKTVGVRLPANPVASRLLEQLDNPLLCSSCHVAPDEELGVEVMTVDRLLEAYPNVDFVVDSGETWVTRGSTVGRATWGVWLGTRKCSFFSAWGRRIA